VHAVARTFALTGIDAEPVHVEVDVGRGLPSFTIVGLPDTAVRESRERVRAALANAGFQFPLHRITTNLAPAVLPKAGPGFDLAIAAALLSASGQLERGYLDRFALVGELALDGLIRPVPGALAMAERSRALGMRGIAVAAADAQLAALVDGVEVVAVEHVRQLRELATGELAPVDPDRQRLCEHPHDGARALPDLADLRGQPALRRSIEVAAAGGHSLLITGPPGAGKTLAARRLPSLLPQLAPEETLEVMRIAGACGETDPFGRPARRPFRSPHHTVSARALIGGGSPPRPGEVTRAHRGVLFLDELGEFRRDALEALREPLETGQVALSRVQGAIAFPCRFMLVAASNPCPCGLGTDSGECECSPAAAARYRAKLSGALADRIDLFLAVERPPASELGGEPGEGSAEVRGRVEAARAIQAERLGPGRVNGEMTPPELRRHCSVSATSTAMLAEAQRKLMLSGRGWDSALRVARTLADLAGSERLGETHVAEAVGMRRRPERP